MYITLYTLCVDSISALPPLFFISLSPLYLKLKLLKWKYKTVQPKENRKGSSSYQSPLGHSLATAISINIKETQNNGKHFGREKRKGEWGSQTYK